MKPELQDTVESVSPMSDYPHPRELAKAALEQYHRCKALRDEICGPETLRPRALTQADIDHVENRTTVDYTRRSIRYHRVSLLRKFLNLFR